MTSFAMASTSLLKRPTANMILIIGGRRHSTVPGHTRDTRNDRLHHGMKMITGVRIDTLMKEDITDMRRIGMFEKYFDMSGGDLRFDTKRDEDLRLDTR
jgi:hypothetical protein